MTCTGWKSSTCCYHDNRALFPFQRPFLVPSHWQCSCFRGFLAFLLTAKAARWDKMTGIRGGNRNRIEMSWVFESDNNDWTWKHNNKHRNAIMGKCAETQHFVVLLKVFSGWHIISASLIIYSGTFLKLFNCHHGAWFFLLNFFYLTFVDKVTYLTQIPKFKKDTDINLPPGTPPFSVWHSNIYSQTHNFGIKLINSLIKLIALFYHHIMMPINS